MVAKYNMDSNCDMRLTHSSRTASYQLSLAQSLGGFNKEHNFRNKKYITTSSKQYEILVFSISKTAWDTCIPASSNLMHEIMILMVNQEKVLHTFTNWFISIWRNIPNKDL